MTLFQSIFVPLCGRTSRARARVPRRTGLFWTAVWIAAAVLIATPDSTTRIAGWLGIGRGADLVLYLTTLGALVAGIYFYGQQRRLEIIVTDLIRRETIKDARPGTTPASQTGTPQPPAKTSRPDEAGL